MFKARIILSTGKGLFHLANFALKGDGSLYLILVRDGVSDHSISRDKASSEPQRQNFSSPRSKTKKISYHASGLVRFHDTNIQSTIREPISAIMSINPLVSYVLPNIEKLNIISKITDTDFVFELKEVRPIQFSFIIAPWQHVSHEINCSIRFQELFALIVEVSSPECEIAPPLIDYVTLSVVPNSILNSSMMREDEAFVAFHQKFNKTQKTIIYSPNSEGVYRIICASPMRVSPRLEVKFFDESYVAEQLPPHPKRGNSEVKFRVKGKGGWVTREVQIASIILDAEL